MLKDVYKRQEYDRRIKISEKSLKEVEEVARGERSKIETEKAEAEKALAELEAARARVTTGIDENMLDHYDRIVNCLLYTSRCV